ncbi:MAG: IS3 family transposase [Gemmatimonadales bacterium]|nr:IS3 family transposase [Gemmatimonadales bacterium]
MTPEQRRTVVTYVRTAVAVSERKAYRFLGLHRALIRYVRRRVADPAPARALVELAGRKRRWGVPRLTDKLRCLGFRVNPKRVRRLCREGRLLLTRRRGRKRVAVVRRPHAVPTGPNQRWGLDFVHDRLADGRAFRVLTGLDKGTRKTARAGRGPEPDRRACRRDARAARRNPRVAADDQRGSRHRLHESRARRVGGTPRRPARNHPPRQAERQRLHRELQQSPAR